MSQAPPQPYRSTAVFDETSLPDALRREHRTKSGVWGVLRVLEGEALFTVADPPGEQHVTPQHPVVIEPEQTHFVTPLGRVSLKVEFYHARPEL